MSKLFAAMKVQEGIVTLIEKNILFSVALSVFQTRHTCTHIHTHLAYSALTPEVCEVVEACESHHTGRTVSPHLDRDVCLFVGACSRICLRVSDQEMFMETSVVVLSVQAYGLFLLKRSCRPRGLHTVGTFIIKSCFAYNGHLHFTTEICKEMNHWQTEVRNG